jgi:hypothetical protein
VLELRGNAGPTIVYCEGVESLHVGQTLAPNNPIDPLYMILHTFAVLPWSSSEHASANQPSQSSNHPMLNILLDAGHQWDAPNQTFGIQGSTMSGLSESNELAPASELAGMCPPSPSFCARLALHGVDNEACARAYALLIKVPHTVQIFQGGGDDTFSARKAKAAKITISRGSGDDYVSVGESKCPTVVFLEEGTDQLEIIEPIGTVDVQLRKARTHEIVKMITLDGMNELESMTFTPVANDRTNSVRLSPPLERQDEVEITPHRAAGSRVRKEA